MDSIHWSYKKYLDYIVSQSDGLYKAADQVDDVGGFHWETVKIHVWNQLIGVG